MTSDTYTPTSQDKALSNEGWHWFERLAPKQEESHALMLYWRDDVQGWYSNPAADAKSSTAGLVYAGPVVAPPKRSHPAEQAPVSHVTEAHRVIDEALSLEASRWLFHNDALYERASQVVAPMRRGRFAQ